jgi:hypothetical protein
VILGVNKTDVGRKAPLLEALPLSARTGLGLDRLRGRILHALDLHPRHEPGAPIVFTVRQQRLLQGAAAGKIPLAEARQALLRGPAE